MTVRLTYIKKVNMSGRLKFEEIPVNGWSICPDSQNIRKVKMS